jgi:hypothetical protein
MVFFVRTKNPLLLQKIFSEKYSVRRAGLDYKSFFAVAQKVRSPPLAISRARSIRLRPSSPVVKQAVALLLMLAK